MNFILKGSICYSRGPLELITFDEGYLINEGGISRGVFHTVPEKYASLPITDYGKNLIIPGLCDLHVHASQYAFRGLGMDMELLDWLNTHAFPEEAKYADLKYADAAYNNFVYDLKAGATTRACVFATLHTPATLLLMEKLEKSGLVTFVGKVNMDKNSPEFLCERDARVSYEDTKDWIKQVKGNNFKNTGPILTPRFVPTCTSELLAGLNDLQKKYQLPVQSHLSENQGEIAWVKDMYPDVGSYGEVYDKFGLLGSSTIMAHCVWSTKEEEDLLKDKGVFIAHCPQSNTNIASGIAPIRKYLRNGLHVGLGSDVAGGCHTSIFRAMSDAIQVSKLYWRLIDQHDLPLTEKEAFYLATAGGGAFFGKVGCFDDGYEFDAVVISVPKSDQNLSVENRLARAIHLDAPIRGKYVRGTHMQQNCDVPLR